jgi:hypothetical protein
MKRRRGAKRKTCSSYEHMKAGGGAKLLSLS